MVALQLLCLFGGLFFMISEASVDFEPTVLPRRFQSCFDRNQFRTPLTSYSGYSVSQDCIAQYTWRIGPQPKRFDNMIVKGDWYDQLLQEVKPRAGCPRYQQRYQRKELRQMSPMDIKIYSDAVLELKSTPFRDTNRYDWFVRLHSGIKINQFHFGCSIYSFARIFTLMFETALRQINPSVTLPYWETPLDEGMVFPQESVIWDRNFLGRADGIVDTGPFRNLETPFGQLFRNVAQEDQQDIPSRKNINDILKQNRLRDIVRPNAPASTDTNKYTTGTHRWLDGQFVTLNQSVIDPVFFNFYAYVDKVFTLFSQGQKDNNINPETDWPGNCDVGNRANDYLFPGITNLDARNSYYTDCVYEYSTVPETCDFDDNCGSKFYRCTSNRKCISKSWQEVPGFSGADICQSKLVPPSIQTGYWIDGYADISQWGFFPVEVNYKFPPEKVVYNNFPMRNNRFDTRYDIYNVPGIERFQQTDAARNQKCAEPPTINIETNGLNYAGLYKDFGLPDTRVLMSQTIVYLAVKKPTFGEDVVFFMSGYDTCGRICKPFCRIGRSRKFYPCSGALRLSSRSSLARNLLDVVQETWDIPLNGRPTILSSEIRISFLCDADSEWIWDRSRNYISEGGRPVREASGSGTNGSRSGTNGRRRTNGSRRRTNGSRRRTNGSRSRANGSRRRTYGIGSTTNRRRYNGRH